MRPLCLALCVAAVAAPAPAQDKAKSADKGIANARSIRGVKVPGYETKQFEKFYLIINKTVLDQPVDPELKVKPLEVLENELRDLGKIIPPKLLKELHEVPIWVEWDSRPPGDDPDSGGRTLAVYRFGSPLAAATNIQAMKMNCVEVMTLKFLTELKQPGQRGFDQIVILHELMHVVHHRYLGISNPDVRNAYQLAMERGLYDRSMRAGTAEERRAYAATNDREYFAEVSCAYLDRCTWFPFTREDLEKHDPFGYKLMVQVWGKPEQVARLLGKRAKPPAKAAPASPPSEPPAAKPDKAEKPAPAAPDAEKAAASKLDLARDLLASGKKAKAKQWLEELVKAFPDTKAAGRAKEMLANWKD